MTENHRPRLKLSLLSPIFSICCLPATAALPDWALGRHFYAITRTTDELSIVCPTAVVPPDVTAAHGWRCFQVHGPLDFAETGILLSLAAPLARAGIAIFAISTYDTDYLLVAEQEMPAAIAALQQAGHSISDHA